MMREAVYMVQTEDILDIKIMIIHGIFIQGMKQRFSVNRWINNTRIISL